MKTYKKVIKKINDNDLEIMRKGFYTFKKVFLNNKKFYEYNDEDSFVFAFLCLLSEETLKRIDKEEF